jgi:hypothetical protein
VTWSDGGEVPQIHRRDGNDPEPLADGDHRRIRAVKQEIGVLAHEARHSAKVRIDKLHQPEGAVRPHPTNVRLLAEAACEQVIDMLGDVAPPAVADPDERGKLAYLLARSRVCADERAEQI